MNEFPFSYQFSFLCRISDLSEPPGSLHAPTLLLSSKKAFLQTQMESCLAPVVLFSIMHCPCSSSSCSGGCDIKQKTIVSRCGVVSFIHRPDPCVLDKCFDLRPRLEVPFACPPAIGRPAISTEVVGRGGLTHRMLPFLHQASGF